MFSRVGCHWKASPRFRVGLLTSKYPIKNLSQACPAAWVLVDSRRRPVDNQDQPTRRRDWWSVWDSLVLTVWYYRMHSLWIGALELGGSLLCLWESDEILSLVIMSNSYFPHSYDKMPGKNNLSTEGFTSAQGLRLKRPGLLVTWLLVLRKALW